MPTSEQAILADTFPPARRGQAFALYGIAVIVAPTVGPTIGGWITDNFSWHWIFFINVPIGIASLALVHWLVDEPEVLERERDERLAGGLKVDWVGFALIAMTLGCLEVVLDRGQIDDWFKSDTIIIFSRPCRHCRSWPSSPGSSIRTIRSSSFGCCFIANSAWRFSSC